MKKLKKILYNEEGDMNMILAAIVMAIVFAIGIIIVYNVLGSLDVSTIDSNLQTALDDSATTPAANATDDLITNVNTFYTVGPIALIVVAAVGILSYVLLLRRA